MTSLAKVVASSSSRISVTQMRRDAYHAKRNKHGRGEAAKVIRGRGDLSAVGTSRHLVRCSRCPELRVNRTLTDGSELVRPSKLPVH